MLLFIKFFGFYGLTEKVVAINIHDTYFVIAPIHYILVFCILFGFITYLVYFIKNKFRLNIFATCTLVVYTLALGFIIFNFLKGNL